ncbi:MAG: acyltransferase family protein [Pseudomonadota bacterium]
MHYRPDIDGLRAVAILPVVVYHAGLPGLPGGYLGVDIFFVISGYLIAGIIAREMAEGRFSLLDFYERRVRRIVPALMAMLAVSTALAFWLLLPHELRDFAFQLRGALLFASNFTLADRLGYFAPAAEVQPLLHTWSLAVEEQFYIIFPLLLLLLMRRRGSATVPIAALLVLSLGAALIAGFLGGDEAFFMPWYRVWELMVGALLAIAAPAAPIGRLAERAGMLGLGLILFALLAPLGTLPLPGAAAVAPVLGAALVIWSGSAAQTRTARLLSLPPFVWVGLISYALYLWHWPILVFWPMLQQAPLAPWQVGAAIALSVGLATLSLHLIERPFRRRRLASRRAVLFSGAGVGVLALVAMSLLADWSDGLPERFTGRAAAALAAKEAWEKSHARLCLRRSDGIAAAEPAEVPSLACRIGPADAALSFVLWGDSHAAALHPAVEAAAQKAGRAGLALTRSACWPLGSFPDLPTRDPAGCDRFNDTVLAFLRDSGIETVILVAKWRSLREGRAAVADDVAALRDAGFRLVLVRDVPFYETDVASLAARRGLMGRPPPARVPLQAFEEQIAVEQHMLGLIDPDAIAVTVDPTSVLCAGGACRRMLGPTPIYADDDHMSPAGALWLAPLFDPVFAPPQAQAAAGQ